MRGQHGVVAKARPVWPPETGPSARWPAVLEGNKMKNVIIFCRLSMNRRSGWLCEFSGRRQTGKGTVLIRRINVKFLKFHFWHFWFFLLFVNCQVLTVSWTLAALWAKRLDGGGRHFRLTSHTLSSVCRGAVQIDEDIFLDKGMSGKEPASATD